MWIVAAIILVLGALILIFRPRFKRKGSTNLPQDNVGAMPQIIPTPLPNGAVHASNQDDIKNIADAINAFTNNLIDFSSTYKGRDINYWVQQIAYLNESSIFELDRYWNERYFQSNGAFTINLAIFDIELGGSRTILYALNRISCGLQGFDCNVKDLAVGRLSSFLTE